MPGSGGIGTLRFRAGTEGAALTIYPGEHFTGPADYESSPSQVIHGYPSRYNAGSEIYTQALCQALAERHEVHVFTREEDPFAPECTVRVEADPTTRG